MNHVLNQRAGGATSIGAALYTRERERKKKQRVSSALRLISLIESARGPASFFRPRHLFNGRAMTGPRRSYFSIRPRTIITMFRGAAN